MNSRTNGLERAHIPRHHKPSPKVLPTRHLRTSSRRKLARSHITSLNPRPLTRIDEKPPLNNHIASSPLHPLFLPKRHIIDQFGKMYADRRQAKAEKQRLAQADNVPLGDRLPRYKLDLLDGKKPNRHEGEVQTQSLAAGEFGVFGGQPTFLTPIGANPTEISRYGVAMVELTTTEMEMRLNEQKKKEIQAGTYLGWDPAVLASINPDGSYKIAEQVIRQQNPRQHYVEPYAGYYDNRFNRQKAGTYLPKYDFKTTFPPQQTQNTPLLHTNVLEGTYPYTPPATAQSQPQRQIYDYTSSQIAPDRYVVQEQDTTYAYRKTQYDTLQKHSHNPDIFFNNQGAPKPAVQRFGHLYGDSPYNVPAVEQRRAYIEDTHDHYVPAKKPQPKPLHDNAYGFTGVPRKQ